MNTFILGLIVVAYLLLLAYLGFLGYKKTTSASDYLVGARQMNPMGLLSFRRPLSLVSGEWLLLSEWESNGCVSSICLSELSLPLSFSVCVPDVWG